MENKPDPTMDSPPDFRCPISMELMKDPVTISTGVTYERENIETWFFSYNKKTCPATMQTIASSDITPNHTLKRLILAWENGLQSQSSSSSPPPSPINHDELVALLNTILSTPFKVSSLKKLRSVIEMGDEIKIDFKRSGGVEVLVQIVVQILAESSDFNTFRACEEALGVLHQLSLSQENETIKKLSKMESVKSMIIMLQRGSAEARFYTISIFEKMAKSDYNWDFIIQDKVLIELLSSSKKRRVKAIEAGAICVLIELLPDSDRSKCEKILLLLKLLCECADGRLPFIEHGLGIAAVSKKMLHVSEVATKIVVKIFWLICSFHPTERVLEEMLIFGSVKKLVAVLHIHGRSATKEKVVKIFKLHGKSWRGYPCFPSELKDYLGLLNDSC
ncbi:hypothetical protein F0562_018616 [Nyssa sinensis]|uniref:U-box domain-containing protein n=1 Tax=Nyssa sinensis TaxID=561372 RepID=A0A5J4ZAF1_9ASTE|nr:hypothetical protein F0562_018616 [Nyssa sinensis]